MEKPDPSGSVTHSMFHDPSAYERPLKLGAMIDYDEVWLNGVSIGSTEHRYLSRRYPVSSDILQSFKAAGNQIGDSW